MKALIIMLLLLAACATPEPATPEPFVPIEVVEPVLEPEIEEPEVNLDGPEFLETNEALQQLSCKGTTLSFTVLNNGTKEWWLDTLPFPPPKDAVQVRAFVNNYADNTYYLGQDGEELMPGNFIDNCDAQKLLPGEKMDCTLTKIPVKLENRLWLDAEGEHYPQRFNCT